MPRMKWDQVGERLYETGVSKGIFYPYDNEAKAYTKGLPWNGLTNVSENPEGGEANPFYADNIKYLNLISVEEYKATITAYMYPDEFAECDGSKSAVKGVYFGQQTRKMFGLCFRTEIGSDTEGNDHGYAIHFVYGCTVTPSSKEYGTVNDSPEPNELSWDLDSVPVSVGMVNGVNYKDLSSVVVKSTDFVTAAEKAVLLAFENYIYGTDATPAVYVKTADTTVQSGKDYYTTTDGTTYTKVVSPQDSDIANYYELVTPATEETEPAAMPLPNEIITKLTVPVTFAKKNTFNSKPVFKK